jgi:hypothetical protein
MGTEFVKGQKTIPMPDGSTVFIKYPVGESEHLIDNALAVLKEFNFCFIPKDWEITIVRKDGTTEKF